MSDGTSGLASLTLAPWEIVLRVFGAMLIGSIIGAEREHTHRPAGMRTHMLVALGAAIAVGWSAVCWKLALVVVLQWCTSPLSGHMLAQLEYRTDAALPAHLELPQETEEGGVRV